MLKIDPGHERVLKFVRMVLKRFKINLVFQPSASLAWVFQVSHLANLLLGSNSTSFESLLRVGGGFCNKSRKFAEFKISKTGDKAETGTCDEPAKNKKLFAMI